MSAKRTIIVICMAGFLVASYAARFAIAQTVYTKTASLPPIRTTYAEMQMVLTKSVTLMERSNVQDPSKLTLERVRIKSGNTQIEIRGNSFSGITLPPRATELDYRASISGFDGAPITTVWFSFDDSSRRFTVEGLSPDQVDAHFAAIKESLISLSTFYGGSGFRTFGGMGVFFVCFSVAWLCLSTWFERRDRRLLGPVFVSTFTLLLLFTLPFDEMLAGFLLSRADPSFVIRYGPELSFWGLVVSIAAIPLSFLAPGWLRAQTATAPSSSGPPIADNTLQRTRRKAARR